ncbi:hypothetical protein [Saccharopolyspora spinosa]|uniref:hypothetical protein n=1 Tax=Saccharopolyspora spinosa TaxID=60894 RepID=UPI000237B2CF|nr:hypothetical protein [Saccharopolyspora spinosa]
MLVAVGVAMMALGGLPAQAEPARVTDDPLPSTGCGKASAPAVVDATPIIMQFFARHQLR